MNIVVPAKVLNQFMWLCLSCLFAVQIESATEVEDLQAIFSEENSTLLYDTGYRKPVCSVSLLDKDELSSSLKLFYTITRGLPELEQFMDGLGDTVVAMIVETPEIMKPLFVPTISALSKSMWSKFPMNDITLFLLFLKNI